MNEQKIVIAGAGGAVGKHLVAQLQDSHSLTLLTRSRAKLATSQVATASIEGDTSSLRIAEADVLRTDTLQGLLEGAHTVISTVGASLDLRAMSDKRSFMDVDFAGNSNLLEEAQRAGVRRFIYLSAFGAESMPTAYTQAHEALVRRLKASGLEYGIVRPTGFFYVNLEFLGMAKSGVASVIGNGRARTNPIHEADVAKACAELALKQGNTEMNIGGPETFTRQEIAELAFTVLGKKPRVMHVPALMPRVMKPLIAPFNKRIGDLVEFLGYVATHECVAPSYGEKRLEDYFRQQMQA
ncbi:MAG: SDR family oxidoreductase [Candidatus Kapabacteria bacterium]|nr:SDR family oxidoreductase [Candidatus Kapabacteria bacterium]